MKEVLENAELPFKDFISISDDVKNVNGYTVPTRIYVKAPYSNGSSYTNSSTYLNKDFIKATLVPDASVTTGVMYKETQFFYAVTEVTKNDEMVYSSSTDCSTEKVAGGTYTIKESATAEKPLTVKISLRAQKGLATAGQSDFDYRVVLAPITLSFKEVDSGVSN